MFKIRTYLVNLGLGQGHSSRSAAPLASAVDRLFSFEFLFLCFLP